MCGPTAPTTRRSGPPIRWVTSRRSDIQAVMGTWLTDTVQYSTKCCRHTVRLPKHFAALHVQVAMTLKSCASLVTIASPRLCKANSDVVGRACETVKLTPAGRFCRLRLLSETGLCPQRGLWFWFYIKATVLCNTSSQELDSLFFPVTTYSTTKLGYLC